MLKRPSASVVASLAPCDRWPRPKRRAWAGLLVDDASLDASGGLLGGSWSGVQ
jgi:hypothetical protein